MKIIPSLAVFVLTVAGAWAQQQPPWHPIQNTNALPTNAVICRSDLLTADASSAEVHRHWFTSLSVTGYFALSWCYTNQPPALASGTLTYAIAVDGVLPSTATFHIIGPTGRHHQLRDLFILEPTGTLELGNQQIKDLLAEKWWFVVENSGTRGGHLRARIMLPDVDEE